MSGVRSHARTFEVGELVLGKYRVVRPLGEGGMGVVIEAENERTTRRVAIKVLHGGSGARSPGAAQRFQNEARAASRLAHPNSVNVLDFEQDEDGTLFIVQELLRGETLYDRIQREGRMPWRDAFDVMLPVMSALAAAHRAGIVHRDVKPENIFLAEVARGVFVPKIIDFGLARVFNDSYRRVTHMDKVVGTPFYMSPEQAAGERELTGQTDVWAAGVVLYECIAGHSPFEGDDVKTLMLNIAAGRLVPFHERCANEPADVVRVIERALEPDRAKRYPTMDAFLDEALACVGPNGGGIGRLVASREKSALDSMRPPPMVVAAMSRPDVTAPRAASAVVETATPKPTPEAVRVSPGRRGLHVGAGLVVGLVVGFASAVLALRLPARPEEPVTTTRLALTPRAQDASVTAHPAAAFDAATTAPEDATAAVTTDVTGVIDASEPGDLGRAGRRLLRHLRRAAHDAGAVRRRW